MSAQAKNLSGGQKRKLSVGIAILGDPKVPVIMIRSVLLERYRTHQPQREHRSEFDSTCRKQYYGRKETLTCNGEGIEERDFSHVVCWCQILLLDEPTAGMDPCSRHQVWSLLKARRAGRVTVLSTHYMDEADILAGTRVFTAA